MQTRWIPPSPLVTALAIGGLLTCLGAAGAWDPRVTGLWLATARLIVATCLCAVPVGLLLAVAIFKTDLPGRRLAAMLSVALVFVPLYLHAAAWDAGFGLQGWYTLTSNPRLAVEPLLTGWRAAIWVHAAAAVPWVVLIVGAGLRTVEPELEEDAILTASAIRVLVLVSLPRAASAILVATLWIAVVCASEIAVTDIFQVRTFAEEVYTQSALGALDQPNRLPLPSTETIDETPLTAGGLMLGVLITGGLATMALVAAGGLVNDFSEPVHRAPWCLRLRRFRWPLAIVVWLSWAALAGVPLGNLVYKAGVRVVTTEGSRERSWSAVKVMHELASAPWEHRRELSVSMQIGVAAATAAVLIAIPLAWSLRRARRVPATRLLVLAVCLAIPGPILGVWVIRFLNQPLDSPWAWLTWCYDETLVAPWLVQTIRAAPMATLILWPALASVPQATLDAASSEGASAWRRVLFVALPQRWPALVAAWLVASAVAVGELAGTVLVIPPGPTTISVKIFSLVHYGVEDQVAAISIVVVLAILVPIAFVAVLYERVWFRKS